MNLGKIMMTRKAGGGDDGFVAEDAMTSSRMSRCRAEVRRDRTWREHHLVEAAKAPMTMRSRGMIAWLLLVRFLCAGQ